MLLLSMILVFSACRTRFNKFLRLSSQITRKRVLIREILGNYYSKVAEKNYRYSEIFGDKIEDAFNTACEYSIFDSALNDIVILVHRIDDFFQELNIIRFGELQIIESSIIVGEIKILSESIKEKYELNSNMTESGVEID